MYNNEQVSKVFLAEFHLCQKIDYFGTNSPKIAKRWGLRPQSPLLLVAGGFDSIPTFRIID